MKKGRFYVLADFYTFPARRADLLCGPDPFHPRHRIAQRSCKTARLKVRQVVDGHKDGVQVAFIF